MKTCTAPHDGGDATPRTLLAETLLDTVGDGFGRLGVHPANLVSSMVVLTPAQVRLAPFHLTTRDQRARRHDARLFPRGR